MVVTAHDLAKKQREISIAEFFEKNKHLLGFDNLSKSLLTCIKEAVDNSLDACEEADILPEIILSIENLEGDRIRLSIEDNGPGITKEQIPRVFGKLLYGSKFDVHKQNRGQQGIGISSAVLYAQLTTGKPTRVYSSIGEEKVHIFELVIDVQKNEPEVISERAEETIKRTGIKIEMEIEGKRSKYVDDYIKNTVIVNPHLKFTFIDNGKKIEYLRISDALPIKSEPIKPHPYGVEIGILIRMLHKTPAKKLFSFLITEFCKVGTTSAREICEKSGIDPEKKPIELSREDAEKLLKAMQGTKILPPPTNCLSPIGEELIEKALKSGLDVEFTTSISRSPTVYRGIPFQIEVGLAYGGSLPADQPAELLRFANKVPLLYEQASCAITQSVKKIAWKRYGIQQTQDSIPVGPLIILVHLASIWVPFTSESKKAIANYPLIVNEIKLGLQDAARKLERFLSAKKKDHEISQKRGLLLRYIPESAKALAKISGENESKIEAELKELVEMKR